MEAHLRSGSKSSLVATLIATILCAPVVSYGDSIQVARQSLATVTQASAALLDHATAQVGTTVYPDDIMETDSTGSLRLRLREAQLYMQPDSTTNLEKSETGLLRTRLTRGTVGFASGTNDPVEIDAIDIAIRSRLGVPAHGRVTWVKADELMVESIRGDFDITFEGITQTIADGKSYRAVISHETAKLEGNEAQAARSPRKALKLLLIIGAVAGGAVGGLYINHVLTESPSDPSK